MRIGIKRFGFMRRRFNNTTPSGLEIMNEKNASGLEIMFKPEGLI